MLTPEGCSYALRVIRIHRLLESYLAERTGVDESEWHQRADQMEHRVTAAEAEALSAQLGNPSYDPHGDPIPTADGVMPSRRGLPLSALKAGAVARIVHVEDEPDRSLRPVGRRSSVAGRDASRAGQQTGPDADRGRVAGARAGAGRRRQPDGRAPRATSPSGFCPTAGCRRWPSASRPRWSIFPRPAAGRNAAGCWTWAWCRARSFAPNWRARAATRSRTAFAER